MSYDTKMARLIADMVGTVGFVLSEEENRRVYQSLRDGAEEVEQLREKHKRMGGELAKADRAMDALETKHQALLAAAKELTEPLIHVAWIHKETRIGRLAKECIEAIAACEEGS